MYLPESRAPTESTSLLPIERGPYRDAQKRPNDDPAPSPFFQKHVILCMAVYFFHQMQGFLPIGPYILLYERSICYTCRTRAKRRKREVFTSHDNEEDGMRYDSALWPRCCSGAGEGGIPIWQPSVARFGHGNRRLEYVFSP